ncbi:hypothetical protein L0F63_006311, partial [Massospora cicadina]
KLAETYSATLTNYAVAGATSDDSYYNVKFESFPNVKVDGCVQQSESLALNQSLYNLSPDETLITLSFFGNDFIYQGATPETTLYSLGSCLSNVLGYTNVHHVLIPTSNLPRLIPRFRSIPQSMRDKLEAISNAVKQ